MSGNAAGSFLAGVAIKLNMTQPAEPAYVLTASAPHTRLAECRRHANIHVLKATAERARGVVLGPQRKVVRRFHDQAWLDAGKAAVDQAADTALARMYDLMGATLRTSRRTCGTLIAK
jgi:hypothetical protein